MCKADRPADGLMFTLEQRAQLRAALERDARLKTNFAGHLYLPTTRLIHSLNAVFGEGMWSDRIVFREKVYEGTRKDDEGNPQHVVHWAVGVSLTVGDAYGHECVHEDVAVADSYQGVDSGGGPNHHMAMSGAYSTALKRCARKLGNFLGASLLDKDDPYGENAAQMIARVQGAEPPATTVPVDRPAPPEPKPAPTTDPKPPQRDEEPPPHGQRTAPSSGRVEKIRSHVVAQLDSFFAQQGELHGKRTWPYALVELGLTCREEIDSATVEALMGAGKELKRINATMTADIAARRTA